MPGGAFRRPRHSNAASILGTNAKLASRKALHDHAAVDGLTDGRRKCLRLHGRDAKAYLTGKTAAERFHRDYSDAEISEVSERALGLAKQADAVPVVFDDNSRDFAPVAAERLRRKLARFRNLRR